MSEIPHYILTAAEEEKDAPVKEPDMEPKEGTDEEKEEKPVEAIIAALVAASGHDGRTIPVVRAKLAQMEEEETDETKKAAIRTAMKVFKRGHGSRASVVEAEEEEPKEDKDDAVSARVSTLEAKIKQPRMAKILQANIAAGATQNHINSLSNRLSGMSLTEFENYERDITPLMNQVATAAELENSIPFQGGVLVASETQSLDSILGMEAKS